MSKFMKSCCAPGFRRVVCASAVLSVLLNLVVIPLQNTAQAWKPITHEYLAEIALADALDDGMVTISKVDYETGRVVGTIGEYHVGEATLDALRQYPDQFRAGAIGPDAYPDILTGQQLIHPDGSPKGPNSNDWLEYLWESSQRSPHDTPQVRSFVLGFLTHAAGDMFGHTFINHFTGGEFELGENAAKHIVLEGYVGKRTPTPSSYNFSILGVEDFIYEQMVYARPGSTLEKRLLVGDGATYSVPYIFSTLRNDLQRDIDDYDNKISDYNRRIDQKKQAAENCGSLNFTCSAVALRAQAAALELEKQGFITGRGSVRAYKVEWRKDIDRGLRAWPDFSHEIARALTYNPNGTDISRASQVAEDYVENHLLSMMGGPDIGVPALVNIVNILSFIPGIQDYVKEMKRDLFNYLLENATGLSVDEARGYLTSPDRYFDEVMGRGAGQHTSLAQINNLMNLDDSGYSNPEERFDYRQFPAAYNTVVMTKLLLMEPSEVNRLLKDLGSSARLMGRKPSGIGESLLQQINNVLRNLGLSKPSETESPNAMLGFVRTLDGDNEWHNHQDKLAFAREQETYRLIFMKQPGERADD